MQRTKTALLLTIAVSVVCAGCLGLGSVSPDSETTVESPSPTTTETRSSSPSPTTATASSSDTPHDPYWAVSNNHSTRTYRVTVYVADGEITNRTYVFQNGTTVMRAIPPETAPPSNVTEIRPTNDVLWSETYVVEPNSSLVLQFDNLPSSATLMEVIVPDTPRNEHTITEYMSGQTTEQCSIQLIEQSESVDSATSTSMSGCAYEYDRYLHRNNTISTSVTVGTDNETAGS